MDCVSTQEAVSVSATPATSLAKFFGPQSIAFVGATEDQSKFGGKCMSSLRSFGYAGRVMPVNPKRKTIFGWDCFPSIGALPEIPDHVGIALPGEAALDALEEGGRLGVPFATVFAAGFGETGQSRGQLLERRLKQICAATGIRVMGPNCNGLVSYVDRFALTSTNAINDGHRPPGDVAIASQSGGAGQINVMWRAMQAGLGVAYQVSSGNDVDLNLLDYIDFMLDAEDVKVVLAIAERIADGDRLRQVAEKAATLDKPIVMLKVGRTAAGSAAAASHTGSITGADEIVDAALEQWGIIRVDDTNDLYEFAKLFRRSRRPKGRRVSAASVSGGSLVMAVDIACNAGLDWPALSRGGQDELARLLPDFGAVRNPMDLTAAAAGVEHILVEAGRTINKDPDIDVFVPLVTMASRAEIESLADFALSADKQPVMLWTGGCTDDPEFRPPALVKRGVPVFEDTTRCFRAIAASAKFAEAQKRILGAAQARMPYSAALSSGTDPEEMQALEERFSKQLMKAYGLPVTVEALAQDASEAVRIANRIAGPVAMKIESPDIPHKTEAKAIRLSVTGDEQVRTAFSEIVDAAYSFAPNAAINGVLVQEMVDEGIELLLGVVNDPVFGPVVTVGAGGIYVEVLKDVARCIAPVSTEDAWRMLRSLRIWPMLSGARGRAALDVDSVVGAITALSSLAIDKRSDISEIDINPLVVLEDGCRVVDALVVARRAFANGLKNTMLS